MSVCLFSPFYFPFQIQHIFFLPPHPPLKWTCFFATIVTNCIFMIGISRYFVFFLFISFLMTDWLTDWLGPNFLCFIGWCRKHFLCKSLFFNLFQLARVATQLVEVEFLSLLPRPLVSKGTNFPLLPPSNCAARFCFWPAPCCWLLLCFIALWIANFSLVI